MRVSDVMFLLLFMSCLLGIIAWHWRDTGNMVPRPVVQRVVVECVNGELAARVNQKYTGARIWAQVVGFDGKTYPCEESSDPSEPLQFPTAL
jgi:hypothetical protein